MFKGLDLQIKKSFECSLYNLFLGYFAKFQAKKPNIERVMRLMVLIFNYGIDILLAGK